MLRRILTLVVTCGLATALAAPAPALAYYRGSSGCETLHEHWKIHTSGGGHVGDLTQNATVCWDNQGNFDGSSWSDHVSNTTWGSLYGFHWDQISSGLIDKRTGSFAERDYESRWEATPCLVKTLDICGHTASFVSGVSLEPPKDFGKPYIAFESPSCLNSWCSSSGHLTFSYNGTD